MIVPKIRSEWRTTTVVALCQSVRETQDYSALPILADALQDADCDDTELLDKLRGTLRRVEAEALTACVFSEKTADSVEWLSDFCINNDSPNYEMLMAAASGHHDENYDPDDLISSELRDGYLFFGGTDAHGDIPDEFWHHVEIVTGKTVTERASHFSCSC